MEFYSVHYGRLWNIKNNICPQINLTFQEKSTYCEIIQLRRKILKDSAP